MKLFTSKRERRIKRWESDLIKRLIEEVADDDSRIKWLIQHLKEYMERWLGFARMEDLTVEGTLNSDLFCVVAAAVNIVESLKTSVKKAWFPDDEWNQFVNTLKWIQKEPNRTELDLVNRTFESFVQKFETA